MSPFAKRGARGADGAPRQSWQPEEAPALWYAALQSPQKAPGFLLLSRKVLLFGGHTLCWAGVAWADGRGPAFGELGLRAAGGGERAGERCQPGVIRKCHDQVSER